MNTERNNEHEELLSELAWCIGNGNTGPRSLAALEKARAALASSPSPAQPQPNDDLLPHLRQFMHNDGSGFVAGYDKQGVDRLVAYLQAKARPQFEIADDLIEWLDTLYTTEGNAITNQKWEPAQRAIAALRAPVSPVAQPQTYEWPKPFSDDEIRAGLQSLIGSAVAQPQDERDTTDWKRIALVQDAKLRAMTEGEDGFKKLCEIMDLYEAARATPAQDKQDTAGNDGDQDVPYLIYYDDRDRPAEVIIGSDAAHARFTRISDQWNAHLFVKVKSNSRDDPYFASNAGSQDKQDAVDAEIQFLEHWLIFATTPIGQECCGRAYQECCGDAVPVYPDLQAVGDAMNARHKELIAAMQAQGERG